jgi:Domain of unknown function (DUF4386)
MSAKPRENKITGRLAGAFLILALIANLVGSEMLDAVVIAPDYLKNALPNRSGIVVGMLLELLSAASVVGVLVLVYSVFKTFSPKLALAYFCFRLLEPAITLIIILASMALLELSTQYLANGAAEVSYYGVMGAIFQEVRNWALMVYIVIFSIGALFFYALLFKSRAVPLLFPIWGVVGIALLLGGSLFEMFGQEADPIIYGMVAGLNELALGVWLLAKGFAPLGGKLAASTGLATGSV